MENVIGGQASHAWVQAYIPDAGWIGLDPTAGEFAEERHILVARGRDYGDVPPVRGVYKGDAGQSLSVDVRVRPAVDDEGAELLQENSGAPPPRPAGSEQQQQQQQ
jgi:transglutaminase-like putative cysteine protease